MATIEASLNLDHGSDDEHHGPDLYTNDEGHPIDNLSNSLTAGPCGPLMMADSLFLETMSSFNHERIPPRGVHPNGIGAYGVFEVTHDYSQYCSAPILSEVGYTCRVFARFSNTIGDAGTSDLAPDVHGLALKLYDKEGNTDFAMTSHEVFGISDPMKFASFVHCQRPNPCSYLPDQNALWDFIIHNQEAINAMMHVHSHEAIPNGYEHMDAYACHAYKLLTKDGKTTYARFKCKTNQGLEFLNPKEAAEISGKDPHYFRRRLYELIQNGEYPSWILEMQLMTLKEAEELGYCYSNITLAWDEDKFPFHEIGTITLNEIPGNHFEHTEQAAFCVDNLPCYIEGHQDPAFTGRAFAYKNAQQYRLGVNGRHLKVNRPKNEVHNLNRDGHMCIYNQGCEPNYYPNSMGGPQIKSKCKPTETKICDVVKRYKSDTKHQKIQAGEFYKSLTEEQKKVLVSNLAGSIRPTRKDIQKKSMDLLKEVDHELAKRVEKKMKEMDLNPDP
ncbi:catalase-like [Leptodactylus fuscus]|uniref:catalase-like n=1 Tax=Leptodactylus fuscus TaxID=238119 RepID=UPI003F4F1760